MVSAHDLASLDTSRILGAPSHELSTPSFGSTFFRVVDNSDSPDINDTPDLHEPSTLRGLRVSVSVWVSVVSRSMIL